MSDPMLDMIATQVTAQVEEANALVATINANTSDKGSLVHDIRTDENTTDEKVREFQEWAAKVEAVFEQRRTALDEYIVANLMPSTENVDVDALKAQHKTLREQIKAGLTFVQTLPQYNADEFKVPDLKNLRGGSSTGTGQGGKRPRINQIWVDDVRIFKAGTDKENNPVEVSNFTLAAAAIGKSTKSKVEVKDLQAAAFAAAKTEDLNSLNGQVFDFYFEAGTGEDRKNVHVKVEPKIPSDSAPVVEGEATPAEESAETVEA